MGRDIAAGRRISIREWRPMERRPHTSLVTLVGGALLLAGAVVAVVSLYGLAVAGFSDCGDPEGCPFTGLIAALALIVAPVAAVLIGLGWGVVRRKPGAYWSTVWLFGALLVVAAWLTVEARYEGREIGLRVVLGASAPVVLLLLPRSRADLEANKPGPVERRSAAPTD